MVEQTYRVDMIPNGVPLVVHVSQYDTEARTLIFELYKGDVAYEVPAGAVASIAGTKPDKTAFIYPMVIDDNVVSIDLKQQMTIVAGDVLAEIQITNSSGKIGSANFVIRVERGPIDEDSVISETDLPIFEQLVSDAQEAASDAQTAANTASVAASSVSAILPASPGSAGQVLTKTATGADWATMDLSAKIKTYGTHGVTVYKIGRICVLSVNEPPSLSHDQNAWNTYAVLDSQFHPIGFINAIVANNAAGAQTQTPLQLRIDSNGTVKVYNFNLSNLQAVGIVTYISKN